MYKTVKSRIFICLIFVSMLFIGELFTSCGHDKEEDDPIGLWDPMEWKTDVPMDKDGVISVPAQGGIYVFNCSNYKTVWISEVWEISHLGKELYTLKGSNGHFGTLETSWGKLSTQKNQGALELYSNESSQSRQYVAVVTAGDIFFQFTFNQAGQ